MKLIRLSYYPVVISAGLLSSVVLVPSSWSHKVGEPELERQAIWKQCCGDGDCVPQSVKLITKSNTGKHIAVNIDGVDATIDKEKFSPVPSNRTWVCYVIPTGRISNENIRCVLYPQKSPTT